MASADVLGAITIGTGITVALSPVAQIRRIWRLGEASDTSIVMYCAIIVNGVVAVAYGIVAPSLVVAVPNGVAAVMSAVTIATVELHRPGRPLWRRARARVPAPAGRQTSV